MTDRYVYRWSFWGKDPLVIVWDLDPTNVVAHAEPFPTWYYVTPRAKFLEPQETPCTHGTPHESTLGGTTCSCRPN